MSSFYERLASYYQSCGAVLRGQAEAASVFPNSTDLGQAREIIYQEFLRNNIPSNCDIFLGGFLFDLDGKESKQLDIIVTTNTCPRYSIPGPDGANAKRFSCVDGTLAVVTVKSSLYSDGLVDALDNLASIPLQRSMEGKILPQLTSVRFLDEWPFTIIYATTGAKASTLVDAIDKYYVDNPSVPESRRPNLIHVAGQYNIIRILGPKAATRSGKVIPVGSYYLQPDTTDVFALAFAVREIQKYAIASQFVLYEFDEILTHMPFQVEGEFIVLEPRSGLPPELEA